MGQNCENAVLNYPAALPGLSLVTQSGRLFRAGEETFQTFIVRSTGSVAGDI